MIKVQGFIVVVVWLMHACDNASRGVSRTGIMFWHFRLLPCT
jgi:hypothetical protein